MEGRLLRSQSSGQPENGAQNGAGAELLAERPQLTGMSEGQVNYRLNKAAISRREFRDGRTDLAKVVLEHARESVEERLFAHLAEHAAVSEAQIEQWLRQGGRQGQLTMAKDKDEQRTLAALRDLRTGSIFPGTWIDGNGDTHFDIPAIHRLLGLPDSPAARAETAEMLRDIMSKVVPAAQMIFRTESARDRAPSA